MTGVEIDVKVVWYSVIWFRASLICEERKGAGEHRELWFRPNNGKHAPSPLDLNRITFVHNPHACEKRTIWGW